MLGRHFKVLTILAGTGLGVFLLSSDADARWGSRGSWGSSGGSWGSSGGSWGSSGGSWGYARRHRHWRRYAHGSHGSWGSSGGSWGSSGGYGHAFSSYGSYGGTVVSPAAPAAESQEGGDGAMEGGAAQPAEDASTGIARDSVLLTVTVPADAKVIINGYETKTTGTSRSYVSRGLLPGQRYKYEIRAEVQRDGQMSSDSKVVYVGAGEQSRLAFNFPAQPAGDALDQPEERVVSQPEEDHPAAPQTTLRLSVPAAATVTLAGAATRSTGTHRVFTTRQLAAGQTWENYVVRAELEQGGRQLTKEVSIRLRAGETRDLAIDFDAADVAAVAAVTHP